MKKLFTLCVALATVTVGLAQRPILVGHRGSGKGGVENTVESFTHGAQMGYEFLETDFKVTKDNQFVCSHDDNTSRLGDKNLTIATSTLAELQAVTLTQTRYSVQYTGRLCSAQEYLDVCKKYNVRPLIELKWATGINSNDCSNIPMLIKFIEDNGFRDKCIILTSMKPCLEYIRKNYPDIELQFLTGQYWANHFDWCVQYGIDVDIEAGYFDKTTVAKYHDANLKVNMWTTNTNDGYKQYGNMGCDFITTDILDPNDLPELDPSITFPPNTVDYPNNDSPIKGAYKHQPVADLGMPAALAGRTVKKAIIDGSDWIVLSFDGQDNGRIDRINALTGDVTSTYSTAGINCLGDIAMTADGILLASNIATVAHGGGGETLRLYSWSDKSAAPAEFFTVESAEYLGNWSNSYAGDHITVSGKLADLKVYLGAKSATANTIRPVGLWIKNGKLNKNNYALDADAYTAPLWGDYTITSSPSSRDCIIIDSPAMAPVEYLFDWSAERMPMTVRSTFADGLIPDSADGISFHRRSSKVYALLPTCADDRSAFNATMYDITDGIAEATPVTEPLLAEGLGTTATHYTTTGFSSIGGKLHVHIFAANNGMASFLLNADEDPAVVEDVDLELTCDWIQSGNSGNKPPHIDGTNAQQGTAVNGYFYINDCADAQVHIFDHTGYLGAIPGGTGWGCARDDAGNILVRNDKLTGTSHQFLIIPAGALPGNFGEYTTIDVEVKLEGQTNFINAGGDLLNGTGHIYLYPNKQYGVNIITVNKGSVTASKCVRDLKVAGSTAGYVIPLDDDPVNWIYQVRGNGLYFNNGGVNSDLSTVRANTTAPARNSTGGGAYFTMRGNNILFHNSGSNYLGGFTVRNLGGTTNGDKGTVVTSVSPIGTLGYVTGGNSSTFNWLIPEKVTDGQFNIYQYCPANGIAKYTLRDKNYDAVNDITVGNEADVWSFTADHNAITVNGVDVKNLRVYNVAGVLVANSNSNVADITSLVPGLYIVTVNNHSSKKFLKK